MEKLLTSLEASLEDHAGLLAAVAQADVVVTVGDRYPLGPLKK
jgi:hypothetical protein